MSEKQRDQILDANYDGIQEYDNDLPRWWQILFILTVISGVFYTAYVHVLNTPTDEDRLAADLEALKSQRAAAEQATATKDGGPDALLKVAADPARVSKGQAAFAMRCAACHGQKGEGLVGPNLTDEYWLHGGTIEEIHKTIVNGVPDKGMLAWKGMMQPDEIDEVTAFIWSIRNTGIPGKAPQGDKVP